MLFGFIRSKFKKWPVYSPHNRINIPEEIIDEAQRAPASRSYCRKIWKKFYSDYPRKPFISKDRELYTDWLNEACIPVEKSMMVPDKNGLLPGHLKMLDWLQHPRKSIPVYFEYQYGINFTEEKNKLTELGYLDANGNLTDKAFTVVPKRDSVSVRAFPTAPKQKKPSIEKASVALKNVQVPLFVLDDTPFVLPETERTGSPVLEDVHIDRFRISDTNLDKISLDFDVINDLLSKASADLCYLKGLVLSAAEICREDGDTSSLSGNIEYTPLTPTGRNAKNVYTLRYYYRPDSNLRIQALGQIRYGKNSSINSADMTFWKSSGESYTVYLRSDNSNLYISRIGRVDRWGGSMSKIFDIRDCK